MLTENIYPEMIKEFYSNLIFDAYGLRATSLPREGKSNFLKNSWQMYFGVQMKVLRGTTTIKRFLVKATIGTILSRIDGREG